MKGESYDWPPKARASDLQTASMDEIQRRTAESQKRSSEALQRALRSAASAEESGAATLEELHSQGEQLRRIRNQQDEIDSNLDASSRLLRGLESWRGAAYNTVSGWFSAREEPKSGPSSTASGRAAGGGTSARDGGARRGLGVPGAMAPPAGSDDTLSQLSSLVSGLHTQAKAMNGAISEHGAILDDANDAADSQRSKLKQQNARLRHL